MCIKRKNLRFNDQRSFKIDPILNKITYPENFIKTSKYNIIDFFPMTLLL